MTLQNCHRSPVRPVAISWQCHRFRRTVQLSNSHWMGIPVTSLRSVAVAIGLARGPRDDRGVRNGGAVVGAVVDPVHVLVVVHRRAVPGRRRDDDRLAGVGQAEPAVGAVGGGRAGDVRVVEAVASAVGDPGGAGGQRPNVGAVERLAEIGAIAVAAIAGDARAQEAVTVRGTVVDRATRAPVGGAVISAGGELAATDDDGRFSLALPPGPLGYVTILPDLVGIWRIQAQMVADMAGVYGQQAFLSREQMLYCLFRHAAAQAMRDVLYAGAEQNLKRL